MTPQHRHTWRLQQVHMQLDSIERIRLDVTLRLMGGKVGFVQIPYKACACGAVLL